MLEHPTWRIGASSASLQSPLLCGEVDLKRPARGLFNLCWRSQALAEHEILGVELAAGEVAAGSLADCYPRGGDLIATYEQTAARPMRVQIDWRAAEIDSLAISIDLQLSVQTSLLDSRPALAVASRLPAGEARRLVDADSGAFERLAPAAAAILAGELPGGPHCWLFRWPDRGLSYAEMAFPSDSHGERLTLSDAGRLELRRRVFVDSLEKGVILRTRIRGVYLPSPRDEELAAAAYREFIHSPPPLDT